jgi:hypothetical protein
MKNCIRCGSQIDVPVLGCPEYCLTCVEKAWQHSADLDAQLDDFYLENYALSGAEVPLLLGAVEEILSISADNQVIWKKED